MAKLLVLLCIGLVSCKSEKLQIIEGRTMGTTFSVKYIAESYDKELPKQINDLLVEVNRQMSTYIKSSEISQLNNSSQAQISPDFAQVLSYSLGLAQQTGGIFDPTIGPLVNLWGFGPRPKKKVPSKEEILKTIALVGYTKIHLQEEPNGQWKVDKENPATYVDLSATAKGFGVDKVSALLKNYPNHLVEIGGEMKASGNKLGQSWRVAIESPEENKRGIHKVLNLKDQAIATSGNYRNFFQEDGRKFSHTIDPKTGHPVRHKLASVTVVDESCMKADGLATALMAMGPEKGYEFAESQNIAAYFILTKPEENRFEIKSTQAFKELDKSQKSE